jgi:hypothetical protein
MSALTAPTMPKRNDKAVKIARDLAMKAKVIAETQGITIAEYLSNLLRGPIEKDWPKALKRLDTGESTGKGGDE